jgi:hypothetical protein
MVVFLGQFDIFNINESHVRPEHDFPNVRQSTAVNLKGLKDSYSAHFHFSKIFI